MPRRVACPGKYHAVVAVGSSEGARGIGADEAALDGIARSGDGDTEHVASPRSVEAVDHEALHGALTGGDPKAVGNAGAGAVQFDRQDGVVPDRKSVGAGARLAVAVDERLGA